jgi:hypothetical protein
MIFIRIRSIGYVTIYQLGFCTSLAFLSSEFLGTGQKYILKLQFLSVNGSFKVILVKNCCLLPEVAATFMAVTGFE